MSAAGPGRLVILSGPSCVGKSPLRTALTKFHPELWGRLQKLVLFNSRVPRPGEREAVDYYFRSRAHVEELRSKGSYAVLDVRGDVQAVDVEALKTLLQRGDVFFEGNPFVLAVRTGRRRALIAVAGQSTRHVEHGVRCAWMLAKDLDGLCGRQNDELHATLVRFTCHVVHHR
jgi:hypothetical protein